MAMGAVSESGLFIVKAGSRRTDFEIASSGVHFKPTCQMMEMLAGLCRDSTDEHHHLRLAGLIVTCSQSLCQSLYCCDLKPRVIQVDRVIRYDESTMSHRHAWSEMPQLVRWNPIEAQQTDGTLEQIASFLDYVASCKSIGRCAQR